MNDFNLPLLRKAVEWAESEARKPWADSEWCQRYYAVEGAKLGRDCGTAYCLAGYIAEQDGGHDIKEYSIDGEADAEIAMELLGIDKADAWGEDVCDSGLFSADNTIEDVRAHAEDIATKYGEQL